MKMFAQLLTILPAILILTDNLVCCNESLTAETVHHARVTRLAKMRCTRRFSPGVCMDEVRPVWTFVFWQRNCTERLGCTNYQMNRFRSYRLCMKQCGGLVEMYLRMMQLDNRSAEKNGTLNSDEGDMVDQHLREGFEEYLTSDNKTKELLENVEELNQNDEDEEYEQGADATRFIEYKEFNVNEDIVPVDVDYVPGAIRFEVDWS